MPNFDFLEKGLLLVSPPRFEYDFSKFHCFIAFTSYDIGQYAYCNYLLPSLWRHTF